MVDLTTWCTLRTTNEPQAGIWFGTILVGTTVSEGDTIDVGAKVENINVVLFGSLRAGTAGNCMPLATYSNGTATITVGGTGVFNTFDNDAGTASELFVVGTT